MLTFLAPIVAILVVWSILGLVTWVLFRAPSITFPRGVRGWFRKPANLLTAAITLFAFSAFIMGTVGLYLDHRTSGNAARSWLFEYYVGVSPELVGVAVTVLIIDWLNRIRSRLLQQDSEKRQLIRQLGSPSNDFALEALREISLQGWLTDGSLRNAHLHKADLTDARMIEADLSGANLVLARLDNAVLWHANLQGARIVRSFLRRTVLSGANLRNADLTEANMAGAKVIAADMTGAILTGANLEGTQYSSETIWPSEFTVPDVAVNIDELNADELRHLKLKELEELDAAYLIHSPTHQFAELKARRAQAADTQEAADTTNR